ncbi:SWI/SNF complex subunit SWI3D [Acorus gramineus]|uniref:SWI/SNF complex subunit SWI3D n=1 Tax=Acorus gramineus TaxID=55184 RepID=A0AAV9AXU1_ACOGR|nr:SWI/SNF complex subunit SWI3D [Acorus gramineus]
MEETPAPPPPPNPEPKPPSAIAPALEPLEPPKRRAASHKRKAHHAAAAAAASFYGGGSSPAPPPPKRLAREKASLPLPLPPSLHNGPCTRARQSPNKIAIAAAAAAALVDPSQSPATEMARSGYNPSHPLVSADEDPDPPEAPLVDADFEAVRTREPDVHVVPTHAGWFSWSKVHPLEERSLPSFFDGKSEARTPETYLEIRNLIMKRFHADPRVQIEVKDLSEITVGDSQSRQQVMEFLDHWGLINFHPFPTSDAVNIDDEAAVAFAAKTGSLLEKLYQFEITQPGLRLVGPKADVRPKADVSVTAVSTRLLQESAFVGELARPGEPSVEYHCNSCSGDCSRKRYHCQKQADFDLCTECYSASKFGSGMTSADFILMESADAPGASGGSWTDQETLLLLEALEIFGGNWNEIAEHVATKTKAQCILHFVQMPIEDPFLEGQDDDDANLQGSQDLGLMEKQSASIDPPNTGETSNEVDGDCPVPPKMSDVEEKCPAELDVTKETGRSVAIDALKAAFEAVGCMPGTDHISIADVGNPVMALAAFLANLVDSDVALTSYRSSLKAMSEDSPGIQLASRHCFRLEDPQNDARDLALPESVTNEVVVGEVQKEEDQMPNSSIADKQMDPDKDSEKTAPVSSELKIAQGSDDMASVMGETKKESSEVSPQEDSAFTKVKESDDREVTLSVTKGSEDVSQQETATPSVVKDTAGTDSPKEVKDNNGEAVSEATIPEVVKECSEEAKIDGIISDSGPSEVKASQQIVSSDSVENAEQTGEADKKAVKGEGEKDDDSMKADNNNKFNKLKRGAVTVLSAAAVKAKLLANQEEEQIRQLAASMIEIQLRKLERKLLFFSDMESFIMRSKEQLDRARQRLYHERAQIVAARLGLPASASRSNATAMPPNRPALNYGSAPSRPLGMRPARLEK